MLHKRAYFRFEASPKIGAGHAIRSCVIADELTDLGWDCKIITTRESFIFIPALNRFDRIAPEDFDNTPQPCDLFVVDHYDLDEKYELAVRPYAAKILVIDDLANRKHACDILVDQTFGRSPQDYQAYVPESCKILTGSEYALIRKEIRDLRPQALDKRRKTRTVERVLVSLGGSDPQNKTIEALHTLEKSGFKGHIDVALGFSAEHYDLIQEKLAKMPNPSDIHVDADMPKLIMDADLAIGAAGSSVWERACLGLPQVLMITAENQRLIYENLIANKLGFYTSFTDYLNQNESLIANNTRISIGDKFYKVMDHALGK